MIRKAGENSCFNLNKRVLVSAICPLIGEPLDMLEWDENLGMDSTVKIKHLVPTVTYEWESGSSDQSLDSSICESVPK